MKRFIQGLRCRWTMHDLTYICTVNDTIKVYRCHDCGANVALRGAIALARKS